MTEPALRAWADRHRPRFHFVAPAGWLNDPNGMVHWRGRYHLFFQYNPDEPRHTAICWGHASSPDLVHWTDEPIALQPGPGPDQQPSRSGVLIDDAGSPTLIYSGHVEGFGQRACLAVGEADLRTWRKYPGNPVIADPPQELDVGEFRDHCVWRADGRWHQLVGAGLRGRGGAALLYDSADLREWTYRGPILVGDAADHEVWTGSTWECVDLFQMGEGTDAHVLVFSVWHEQVTQHSVYARGHFDGRRFTAATRALLDLGLNYFYAPQSMRDATGRRVLMGWVQEGRSAQAQQAAGWSGVMSLPRQAELTPGGALEQWPVAELNQLRTGPQSFPAATMAPGECVALAPAGGDQFDLEATVRLPPEAGLELLVRATPDGAEVTRLGLEAVPGTEDAHVRLDRTASSRDPGVDTRELSGQVRLRPGRRLDLRVLVDHSVLEIFANGRPLTARVYPTRADATGAVLRATAGEPAWDRLDVWVMRPVWHGPRAPRPSTSSPR